MADTPSVSSDKAKSDAEVEAAEISRLVSLPPLTYSRERTAAAQRLGVSVTALDEAVKRQRIKSSELPPGQGTPLALPEIVPWHEPVDGVALLADILDALRQYLVLDVGLSEIVALWVLHAHTLDAFTFSPRLAVMSPERQCGKTTLLDVLMALVPRPLPTANTTTAAIFRTIEAFKPTLLMDEADTFLLRNDEMRGILNSGHRRSTAFVTRLVGDDHEPRSFSTWCATAIALIGNLPSTLEDRSIPIKLRRRLPSETVKSFRVGRAPELGVLARKVNRWADDHVEALRQADPAMPEGLYNRQADNWAPLLAIADEIGGEWPGRVRRIALAFNIENNGEEQSTGLRLLSDIRDIFYENGGDRVSSAMLIGILRDLGEGPWAARINGREFTHHVMSRLLRRFGIRPQNIKVFGNGKEQVLKGYYLKQFKEAWDRYLPNQLR